MSPPDDSTPAPEEFSGEVVETREPTSLRGLVVSFIAGAAAIAFYLWLEWVFWRAARRRG